MGDDGQHITVWVAIVGKHACWRKNDKCIPGLHAVGIVTRHRRDVLHLDHQRRGRGADAVTHHVGHEFIAREACVRRVLEGAVGADADRAVACGAVAQHREGVAVAIAVVRQHTGARGNREGIAGVHRIAVVHRRRRFVLHLDRQRRGRGADAVTHHVGHEFIAREACVRHVGKATVSRHGQAPVCGGTDRNHGERICVGVRVVGQQPGCRADAQGVSGMHAIGIVGPDRRRICGQHRQREAAGAGVQAVLIAQGNRNRAGTGGSVGVGYRTARSDARRRAVSPTDEVLGH